METGYVHEALPSQVTAEVTDIILNKYLNVIQAVGTWHSCSYQGGESVSGVDKAQ